MPIQVFGGKDGGQQMNIYTVEEIIKIKKSLGISVKYLSEISSVPEGTIQKILNGSTGQPRYGTMKKLTDALRQAAGNNAAAYSFPEEKIGSGQDSGQGSGMAKEPAAAYNAIPKVDNPYGNKMQGEYTVEDYLALPDDHRYELIDGVIYEMASPTSNHQEIAGYLYYRLMTCAEEHHMTCRPYIAPLDVQLDKDNRTMVQPDVIICCDRSMNIGPRLFGAPDFLAEVLSPSSRARDMFLKLNKYRTAGVREYWLIDPKQRKVIVYRFDIDDDLRIYGFEEDIPVGISDGICSVNFKALEDWLI